MYLDYLLFTYMLQVIVFPEVVTLVLDPSYWICQVWCVFTSNQMFMSRIQIKYNAYIKIKKNFVFATVEG